MRRKMNFDSVSYAELQRLAKEAGFKANMKANKLREALKQHYETQPDGNGNEPALSAVQADTHGPGDGGEHAGFVTKRRGRGSKRKNPGPGDAGAHQRGSNVTLPLCPTEEFVEKAPVCEIGSAKRRRLSQDSGISGSAENTKETSDDPQPNNTGGVGMSQDKGEEKKVMKAGRIPRHEALLKRNRSMLKPTTPNFKKLHEAHFNKMESIDSYVQRKTKQMEGFKNSVKELKLLSDKTKTMADPTDEKTQAKSSRSRASLFSPAPVDKKLADKRRDTNLAANKPAQGDTAPFRPSVLSTRRINVRFSQATQNNEHKASLVKTPARMSSAARLITPGKETNVGGKPEIIMASVLSSTKTPGSAFVFNANTTLSDTPGTNKKPSFDLKASLSRPLNYKPHTGKLKPFGPTQETSAGSKSETLQLHQKNFKQHQVQTRDGRRTKHQEDRKQKKENMLGARRGLVMT